ncbi:MAG TPA: helix-turn-helix transcriptional regulator [Dehalococcoidales bacterium]|nr:helix-turn-helix transcriptional regulator [Dehalococcoidales bacterium]
MSPLKTGDYEFKKGVLVDIRRRMGLSQAKMAELLGLPPNTLSRWENGSTVPDADSLASIYSIAKKNNLTVEFFGLRGMKTEVKPLRYRLMVFWDFQTYGVAAGWVKEADTGLSEILKNRFGDLNDQLLKAFIHPDQRPAGRELEKLGWSVREGRQEITTDMVNTAKSLAGQDPAGTVLALISKDNSLFNLVEELKSWGVLVFIFYNRPVNNRLLEGAGEKFGIQWAPLMTDAQRRNPGTPFA